MATIEERSESDIDRILLLRKYGTEFIADIDRIMEMYRSLQYGLVQTYFGMSLRENRNLRDYFGRVLNISRYLEFRLTSKYEDDLKNLLDMERITLQQRRDFLILARGFADKKPILDTTFLYNQLRNDTNGVNWKGLIMINMNINSQYYAEAVTNVRNTRLAVFVEATNRIKR